MRRSFSMACQTLLPRSRLLFTAASIRRRVWPLPSLLRLACSQSATIVARETPSQLFLCPPSPRIDSKAAPHAQR
jgi:hypothetical protein